MTAAVPTDIVRFTDKAICTAAIWCRDRGITGKVVRMSNRTLEIDVGLSYIIYALQEHVEVVAVAAEAPIPDDQGIY